MTQIGEFTRTKSGFTGRIATLMLDLEIAIRRSDPSEAENAPDHRIHLGTGEEGPEIGAAWTRTGEKAGEYLAVLIDDPTLPHPIRANLFQNGSDAASWSLNWTRAPKRDAKD